MRIPSPNPTATPMLAAVRSGSKRSEEVGAAEADGAAKTAKQSHEDTIVTHPYISGWTERYMSLSVA